MATTQRTIPATIRKKLERIAVLRSELHRLAYEVESGLGLEGEDDSNCWSLGMHLDANGPPPTTQSLVDIAERFAPYAPEDDHGHDD